MLPTVLQCNAGDLVECTAASRLSITERDYSTAAVSMLVSAIVSSFKRSSLP
jgi:hypothetical protein